MRLDWTKMDGLLPVIVQDADNQQVLMLAYTNQEALAKTEATGEMHYWSRSRARLWRKGEESGNVQRLISLALDCDGDAILAQVKQVGVACHTGKATCFHNSIPESAFHGTRPVISSIHVEDSLWDIIRARQESPVEGSYTNRLLEDENLRLKKLAEEASEVIMACKDKDREQAIKEFADLAYHSLVAMAAMGISPRDVADELAERRGPKG